MFDCLSPSGVTALATSRRWRTVIDSINATLCNDALRTRSVKEVDDKTICRRKHIKCDCVQSAHNERTELTSELNDENACLFVA